MKKKLIAIISIFSLILSSFQTVYADTSNPGIKVYSPYTYVGKGPLDAKQSFDTKTEMASFDEAYLDDGMRTYCKENDTWYEYNSNNVSNAITGKWERVIVGQYAEMPEPNEDRLGDVYQYTGTDTVSFKRGYFYEVVLEAGVYVYKQKNVQDQLKVEPLVLDANFKSEPYNYNKLDIDNASLKVYNGMLYANIVAKYKVKKTDISTGSEIVMVLPELPATASTTYPYSCQVTITTPKGEYITCEQNRHEFFDVSGSHYVDPNCAIGEPFFINNFTRIENAYSDIGHTTNINICAANLTSGGKAIIDSDGINVQVKKHGVHFNVGEAIPETLYRCIGNPIQYTYVSKYYDENGNEVVGDFYELTEAIITPNIDYLYKCKLINEMRKYCGENYMVDETGRICSYLITENNLSKQLGCLYDMAKDEGYGFGIDGTILKTSEPDKGFSYTMNAEIDPATREVKIPAMYPIEKVVMTISGQ